MSSNVRGVGHIFVKRGVPHLLERDREFRYAVIGYLGLDRIEKTQVTILEEIRRLWEEVKALREGQEKLWEGQKRLWEEVRRLWEEVKSFT